MYFNTLFVGVLAVAAEARFLPHGPPVLTNSTKSIATTSVPPRSSETWGLDDLPKVNPPRPSGTWGLDDLPKVSPKPADGSATIASVRTRSPDSWLPGWPKPVDPTPDYPDDDNKYDDDESATIASVRPRPSGTWSLDDLPKVNPEPADGEENIRTDAASDESAPSVQDVDLAIPSPPHHTVDLDDVLLPPRPTHPFPRKPTQTTSQEPQLSVATGVSALPVIPPPRNTAFDCELFGVCNSPTPYPMPGWETRTTAAAGPSSTLVAVASGIPSDAEAQV
ncbi:hypothetical protein F5Y15DRAFT_391078 [Xylariaceae sp. FL0016]|nr:hypothetical protein F5Y15DRAFT_391078 [Xylariaceae sp. FL0016]